MFGSCVSVGGRGFGLCRPSFVHTSRLDAERPKFGSKVVGSPLGLGSPLFLLIELFLPENAMLPLMIESPFRLLA